MPRTSQDTELSTRYAIHEASAAARGSDPEPQDYWRAICTAASRPRPLRLYARHGRVGESHVYSAQIAEAPRAIAIMELVNIALLQLRGKAMMTKPFAALAWSLVAALLAFNGVAGAAEFVPYQPLTMVVPFAARGP